MSRSLLVTTYDLDDNVWIPWLIPITTYGTLPLYDNFEEKVFLKKEMKSNFFVIFTMIIMIFMCLYVSLCDISQVFLPL